MVILSKSKFSLRFSLFKNFTSNDRLSFALMVPSMQLWHSCRTEVSGDSVDMLLLSVAYTSPPTFAVRVAVIVLLNTFTFGSKDKPTKTVTSALTCASSLGIFDMFSIPF